MTTLKEEYEKRKRIEEKKELIKEYTFLKENFVIFEEIDRQELLRMAQAMEKLESVFKSLPDRQKKIPLLSSILESALNEAEKFVSDSIEGRLSPAALLSMFAKRKWDNPLTKVMGLFTTLTNFLKYDVDPILKVFRADKNPTVPLHTLPNANQIADAFAKAMQPKGFLASIGIKQIPYIGGNIKNVATELANLTPKELNDLKANLNQVQIPISQEDMQSAAKSIASGQNPVSTTDTAAKEQPASPPPEQSKPQQKPISVDDLERVNVRGKAAQKYVMNVLKTLGIPTVENK